MPNITYQVRSRLFQRTQVYTLSDGVLSTPHETIPLGTISSVRIYAYPGVDVFATGTLPSVCWCKVSSWGAKGLRFRNQHIVHPFVFEDRTATFRPFVKALCTELAACHPDARLLTGLPPLIWWICVIFFGAFAIVGGLGLILMVLATLIGGTKTVLEGFYLISLFLFMFVGPASYLRAIWGDRTRPIDPTRL